MCEQKLEQEQERRTGMKILGYVDDQDAAQIAEVLKQAGCLAGRKIVYNNLRTQSEIPGVRSTCSRTEAELFREIESLSDSAPCCYVLDHLHAVENSTDMATPPSIGRALFHAASTRGDRHRHRRPQPVHAARKSFMLGSAGSRCGHYFEAVSIPDR